MRYSSIDLLRTYAIALMIVVHFLENLAGAAWTPAGFGAPLFAFLAGLSFHLWASGQSAKGTPEETIRKVAVRRGLFLFALGFAFNVLVWLPEDTFNWDVLTMIGTTLVVLGLGRSLPPIVLASAAGMILTLSPFLRMEAHYAAYWTEMYFQCEHTLSDVLIGYFATGYFPIFPWSALPIAGYLTGLSVFPQYAEPGEPQPSLRPLVLFGSLFVIVSLVCRSAHAWLPAPLSTSVLTGWTMFPASVEYMFGVIGIALLLFAAGHKWVDRSQWLARWPGLLRMAGRMSRHSLSLYLLHHVVHLWPLWISGILAGTGPTSLWRKAMTVEVSLALAFACFVACYLFAWLAERYRFPTAESVMRWLCD
jgi:uncharacterized membrane protein